jgi:hypothetical protein
MYAPFTVLPQRNNAGFLGTVNQPLHPIMSGVSALYVALFRTGNTSTTLRSPNCVSLAEYGDSSRCLAASFDSAGQRAASLSMFPLTHRQSTATGQWCRLIVNALNWATVGPSVGVTVPNGGENWSGGTVHNITWTQTSNGVKDSIYRRRLDLDRRDLLCHAAGATPVLLDRTDHADHAGAGESRDLERRRRQS